MKYSTAFEILYSMSFGIDLITMVKYNRVAEYIGRVMVSEAVVQFYAKPNIIVSSRIYDWAKKLEGKKEPMLDFFLQITDAEWEKIRPIMMQIAEGSYYNIWNVMRIGYVHDLDTLRAFN